MPDNFGKTLLIANPTSQNGRGGQYADRASRFLYSFMDKGRLEVVRTRYPNHAVELASKAAKYDTVIALGGDGVIHETVQGLMKIRKKSRPNLGLIAVGSGNDYARTLGLPGSFAEGIERLRTAKPHAVDLGCANGHYFTETLSFGLDAAIALDTMQRRIRTSHTGTRLYMESGFDQLLHHMRLIPCQVSIDGADFYSTEFLTFAIQNGPYYGGGFKVCPNARIDDGMLDVCIAHGPFTRRRAAMLFVQAKSGRHVGKETIEHFCCKSIKVRFDEEPPAQIDGEKIEANVFEVSVEQDALSVLR